MKGKRLLHSIRLKNFLSYGGEGVTLDLEPLNVFIGPNASGKSNLIEALSLLAATPTDLMKPLREGGGTEEFLWKGVDRFPIASLGAVIEYSRRRSRLWYQLLFTEAGSRFSLVREQISEYPQDVTASPFQFYSSGKGISFIGASSGSKDRRERSVLKLRGKDLDWEQSILSQRKDPKTYPELTYLGKQFGEIKFFRDWGLGEGLLVRGPQRADLPNDFLLEDASNLGLVLNDIGSRLDIKKCLVANLKRLNEDVEDVTTKIQGGTIQILFHERGLKRPVPASRISDGTLHYLCLLVILLHPEPPPLICIEEPELGLHPDVIPTVADLLVQASQRTQLIVTTHSDSLVSALSDVPESVVICERGVEGTQLRRLEPEKLKDWLDRYRLGELWAMGEIGGNR